MSTYFIVMISAIAVLLCGCNSQDSGAGKAVSDPFIEIIDFTDLQTIELEEPVDSDSFAFESVEPETDAAETVIIETEALYIEADVTDAETDPVVIDLPDTSAQVTADLETAVETSAEPDKPSGVFAVINTSSGKFHLNPDCSGVRSMNVKNRLDRTFDSVDVMIAAGYTPCGICSKDETAKTETSSAAAQTDTLSNTTAAVLNTNSKKIHIDVNCRHVSQIKASNRKDVVLDEEYLSELIADGYTYCKGCS